MSTSGLDMYRMKTRLKSLGKLFTLEQREVDAFMDSYLLFDGDWSNENGKREEQIIDYYNVLNHLCALGNVEKMYFPPLIDTSVGVTGNQVLFEQKMMRDIGVQTGTHALEIGCGRGRVANHVTTQTGASVTGINIDPSQIRSAREFAERLGLEDKCRFQVSSLNDPLPFADETFDGGYEIQAFSYAKDLATVFGEIFRVLKPGARFSYLDWVLLPGYDSSDQSQVDLVKRACALMGAVESPTVHDVTNAMQKVGFEVVVNQNPSIGGQQNSLITAEDNYFHALRKLVGFGAAIRLLPRYFPLLMDRLMKDADALIEVDQRGIGTTAYHIVCEKPPA